MDTIEAVDSNISIWEVKGEPSTCAVTTLSRSASIDSIASLSSVASSTSSSRPKNYFCDYDGCNKSFTRPSLLTEHQLTVHQGIKPFKCHHCERTFAKKSHLERHMFTHSDNKPFHCSYCGKGVTTKQQLKRHEITHTKSFKCEYEGCNECFYKHSQLRSHTLSVHLQKLTCEHCGKKFQRPYRLQNHLAKHHNVDVENKYQCTYMACTETFKTWTALQQHIKADHPKLHCNVCGKACVGESGLQMHMRVHDEALVIKNWKCTICQQVSFAKKADLLSHYMEHHKDDIPQSLLDSGEDIMLKTLEPVNNSEPKERLRPRRKRKTDELVSIDTEVKLRKYIESGGSSLNLLLNSAGRKHKCPYSGCYRTFKTEEKYEKHIGKHKVHELKLKILEEKDNVNGNNNENGGRSSRNDQVTGTNQLGNKAAETDGLVEDATLT